MDTMRSVVLPKTDEKYWRVWRWQPGPGRCGPCGQVVVALPPKKKDGFVIKKNNFRSLASAPSLTYKSRLENGQNSPVL